MEWKYITISIMWISISIGTIWSKDYATMFWGGFFACVSTYIILSS